MTNYTRGQSHTLTATFQEYEGGPFVDVTGLTIQITQVSDNEIIIGPTSSGVEQITTGVYAYEWSISSSAEIDEYVITWTGIVDSDDVTAIEIVGVIAAGSSGSAPCMSWPVRWMCDLDAEAAAVTGDALQAATEVLWSLSGRRFGLCTTTLRPCKRSCSDAPWFNYVWPAIFAGQTYPMPVNLGGGEWLNLACGTCLRDCSCTSLEEVVLPGTVYDIIEVKVDGVVLSPTAYRVDNQRLLVRIDGGAWPSCNDLNLADTEVGTWSVTARYGEDVPMLGQMAVGELACQFVNLFIGADCTLPQPLQSISRQGVSITYVDPNELLQNGRLGMRIGDMFIQSVNPSGLRSRSRFYSVDGPNARVVGT